MAVCLLAVSAALAQEPSPPAPAPARFADRDTAAWADRLLAEPKTAVAELAAGRAAALPALADLLAHADTKVVGAAARACEAMGPAAAPLVPALGRGLCEAPSWWTQMECGNALAAIGTTDRAILDALLAHVRTSDVPRLRAECARALDRLVPDAPARVLAAAATGDFAESEYAIEALVWIGERAVAPLIESLRVPAKSDAVARSALVRSGWRAVPFLERAGLVELVEAALLEGPLRHVSFSDWHRAEWVTPPPAVTRLPELVWEYSEGHGNFLSLCRAAENEGALRFDLISVVMSTPVKVTVRTTTLPTERTQAMTRQLVALAHTKLVAKRPPDDSDDLVFLHGSNNFHAFVHLSLGAKPVLDVRFSDYPTSDNLQARFRPEAASAVLHEGLAGTTWIDREPTAADREFVAARLRDRPAGDPAWLTERLVKLREALARR